MKSEHFDTIPAESLSDREIASPLRFAMTDPPLSLFYLFRFLLFMNRLMDSFAASDKDSICFNITLHVVFFVAS